MTATIDAQLVPPTQKPALEDVGISPPLTRQRLVMRVVIVAFVAATAWAWWYADMSISRIVTEFGDVINLLQRMMPPKFVRLDLTIDLVFETLWMAIIGTTIAVVLSFPLAFGAARNTTPHPLVMAVCRAIIVLGRAIPDLVFAMIFVRAVGIGPLAGILALGLHSIGMVGKLFADAIEQTSPMPREAVTSVGAGKWQAITTSVLPQAMPSFIATALYRLDINLRSSTVLGLVGAGGVGVLLQQYLRSLRYDAALGVVIVIFVFITIVELLGSLVRATLLGGERTIVGRAAPRFSLGAKLAGMIRRPSTPSPPIRPPFNPETVRPPFRGERAAKTIYGVIFAALVIAAFWFVRVSPLEVVEAVPDMWRIVRRMFPLDYSSARESIVTGITESIAIAFLATFFGSIFALPVGLLAARNVTVNRVVYAIARLFLVFLRGIPELILAVIFISAMGLGMVPGTYALIVGSTAFFAKLIADSVEEVDPVPREAVFATGATRLQETATSVIPQAMPAIVGNALYVLDINLRSSAILGIVGGGGIGFILNNAQRVLEWRTVGAIIVLIFVLVYGIELLAGWVRKQII